MSKKKSYNSKKNKKHGNKKLPRKHKLKEKQLNNLNTVTTVNKKETWLEKIKDIIIKKLIGDGFISTFNVLINQILPYISYIMENI